MYVYIDTKFKHWGSYLQKVLSSMWPLMGNWLWTFFSNSFYKYVIQCSKFSKIVMFAVYICIYACYRLVYREHGSWGLSWYRCKLKFSVAEFCTSNKFRNGYPICVRIAVCERTLFFRNKVYRAFVENVENFFKRKVYEFIIYLRLCVFWGCFAV